MEEEEVRAALQHAVAQICTDEMHDGNSMTKGAIQTLTELTYIYSTTCLSNDLVTFSKHANRRTITPDDIILMARKNPNDLKGKLKEFAEANDCHTQSLPTTTKNLTDKRNVATPTRSSHFQKQSKEEARRNQDIILHDTESDCSSRIVTEPKKLSESSLQKSRPWDFSDSDDDSEASQIQNPISGERRTEYKKSVNHMDHSSLTLKGSKRKKDSFQQEISSSDDDEDPPLLSLKKPQKNMKRSRSGIAAAGVRTVENLDLSTSEEEATF